MIFFANEINASFKGKWGGGVGRGAVFSGQSQNVFLPVKCGLSSAGGCFKCLVWRNEFHFGALGDL